LRRFHHRVTAGSDKNKVMATTIALLQDILVSILVRLLGSEM
jgi:hypothetical protein